VIESTARQAGPARVWPNRLLSRLLDDRLVLPGLYLLGLAPRLWDLGRRSFWLDELSSVGTSALSFGDLRQALTVEANMTLYYWALFVWLRLVGFGADEWLIRLLSVIVASGAIPLSYLLGRRLHSRPAGLAAAGLLAANPFHILMSQEARAYAQLSVLTLMSFLLLDRAVERGRWRDWLWHGLVSTLAWYSHFYTALTMLGQGLFVLTRRSRAAVAGLAISGLLMLLLLAQLVPFFMRQAGGAKLSHLLRPDLRDGLNFLISFAGGSEPTFALYLVFILVGLLSGAAARAAGYRAWLLLSWLLVPTVLAFGVSQIRPIFNDRYLFATLPALPLLAGVGLARLPRSLGWVCGSVLVALSLWTLTGDFAVRRDEQWREAVAYTSARAQPGDGYIFVSKWGQNGFEYYADWHWGTNPRAPYADVFEPFDWLAALRVPKYRGVQSLSDLEGFSAGHPRIWLILSHEFDSVVGGDTAEPVRNWLTRHGYAATQRQLKGVRVLLYQRR
jgi:mannosyltransferase